MSLAIHGVAQARMGVDGTAGAILIAERPIVGDDRRYAKMARRGRLILESRHFAHDYPSRAFVVPQPRGTHKMSPTLFLLLAVTATSVSGGGSGVGPAPPNSSARPDQTVASGITNQDIIALVKAGFSDELVISRIEAAEKRDFNLSAQALVALKGAGVSERVVGVMLGTPPAGPPATPMGSTPATALDSPKPLLLDIKDGTEIRVRTTKSLVSNIARVGDLVELSIADDVVVDGRVVVQKGSLVSGKVTQATPQLLTRAGKLEVTVDLVKTSSGVEVPLRGIKSISGGRGLIRGDEATLAADTVFIATVAGNHSLATTNIAKGVPSHAAPVPTGTVESSNPPRPFDETRKASAQPESKVSTQPDAGSEWTKALSGSRREFETALSGMAVTLKRDLHTVQYIAEGGLGTSAKPYVMPIVVVTRNQTYYEASVRGEVLNDDDPQRLVNQVSLKTGSRSAAQRVLGSDDSKARPDRRVDLSTYSSGEAMVVMEVGFKDNDIMISLGKAMGNRPKQLTGFRIRLEQKISAEFVEEADVRRLIDQVLNVSSR